MTLLRRQGTVYSIFLRILLNAWFNTQPTV
uniref:Uncharacterized protein n=1 Tax=Anguilla anguilla TaxID=7936 RepID=A0A0E9RGP0_ANGAN